MGRRASVIGNSLEEADEAQTLLLPPPRGSFDALVSFQLLMAAQRTLQEPAGDTEEQTPNKLEEQGWDALAAGDLSRALRIGDELLQLSRELPEDDWNFGNLLHDGHIIRGYALLRAEDLEGAKAELRAAGQTPGSPQLDSFGPDITLAWELLRRGQDQAALDYFHDISRFWAPTGSLELAEKHRARHGQLAGSVES